MLKPLLILALASFASLATATAEEPVQLHIDCARARGTLRPLHGINKGPLTPGGLLNLTDAHRALGIPSTRLHDCHWPNPDVVDFHAVFPRFEADPKQPENYVFGLTDEYVAAVRATGAQIVYRLGESIEHTSIKRFVHPPADFAHWADAAVGIIRHYNEGWAGGFRYGIRYWEIWNEPENRPVMWTGTDDQFLDFYITVARAVKKHDPNLLVGGPSFGASGSFVKGKFQPTEFAARFLDRCQREAVPLDFFSWHCYTADPAELVARARAIRQLLDAHGFTKTESHLNEWNYLPGNSWKGASKTAAPELRQSYYAEMSGPAGAAFIGAALLELQDAPLDVGNLFHGEAGDFGLFTTHGVKTKNYHALLAFHDLLDTPKRVELQGAQPGKLAAAAGLNEGGTTLGLLVSNYASPQSNIHVALDRLPWTGPSTVEIHLLDATRDLELTRTEILVAAPNGVPAIDLLLPPPAVAWITLKKGKGSQ